MAFKINSTCILLKGQILINPAACLNYNSTMTQLKNKKLSTT